jgi:hypothetical protein
MDIGMPWWVFLLLVLFAFIGICWMFHTVLTSYAKAERVILGEFCQSWHPRPPLVEGSLTMRKKQDDTHECIKLLGHTDEHKCGCGVTWT